MTNLWLATGNALASLCVEGDRCRVDLHLDDRPARCVAVDPLRPQLLYCGTFGDGLWRSDDGGRSWRPTGEGIAHRQVLSVAVSRPERVSGRGVVFAGTEPSAVFRSEDAGQSWRECIGLTELPSANQWSFPPRPQTHHVRWIEPDPHAQGRLFVAIEAGALVRSPDGGRSWQDRRPDGPRDTHQLATHLSAAGRLYSAAGDGYFESRDGGNTWQQPDEGLRHGYVWSVAVDAGDADTVLVSAAAGPRPAHDKERAESFLYRRTTGSAWQEIRGGLPEPTGRRTAVLAAHPTERGVFFAAWENDVYRSVDGGATWDRLDVTWPGDYRVERPHALVVVEPD